MRDAAVHKVPVMYRGSSRCLLSAVILFCQALFGCTPAPLEKIDGGSRVARAGWWFSAGTIFLQHDVPGLLLGMRKPPDGRREIAYVLLFRHEISENSQVQRPDDVGVTFDGQLASMKDGITVDGKTISLRLDIEVDQKSPRVNSETLTVAGETIQTSAGRVLLVDLTVDPPMWQQVSAQLPTDLPDPAEKEPVRELTRKIITDLSRTNTIVAQFLMKRR